MKRYRILVTPLASFGKYSGAFPYLAEHGCEVIQPEKPHPLSEEDLLKAIENCDGAIVGLDPVTARVLEGAKCLRVVAKHGVGVDNIDVEAATRLGIVVAYAPGTNDDAVAEFTIGLILALARRIPWAFESLRARHWEKFVGWELRGKVLGVIGTGRIGKKVLEKARGFSMEYLAFDLAEDRDFARQFRVRYVSLEELLSLSDFVTLHVPLTPKTRGLLGERELRLLKPTAFLINTSRGGVVDEGALFRALKEQWFQGAALDVFSLEPPFTSPLLDLPNVLVTPHMGADTIEALNRMDMVSAENVVRVLEGREPLASVNFEDVRRKHYESAHEDEKGTRS